MSILRECFDNAKHSSDKWEPYFEVYERHLTRYRGTEFNFVEVGVQKGGSLDMWHSFFGEGANITGIDVDPECANLVYDTPKIRVEIGDQGDAAFWDKFISENVAINVFVDDGGHYMDQQILTFEKVFPTMPLGSIYICEDCHTSYMSHNGGGLNRPGTFIEYAKQYVDVLHWEWKEQYTTKLEKLHKMSIGLTGVFFYDSMVVFEKFGKRNMQRVSPKL